MARYCIDGIEFPSPTEILNILDKPALKQWAVNMAIKYIQTKLETAPFTEILAAAKYEWKNVAEEAMDIGSEIHKIIENYIKFGRDAKGQYRPEVENGFLAFLEWEKKNVLKWYYSELIVVSFDYGFAGTLDAIALMKNKDGSEIIRLIDFKSSKDFYPGYKKQVSFYLLAIQEMIQRKIRVAPMGKQLITVPHNWRLPVINGGGVLRLDKETGQPDFRNYDKDIKQKTEAAIALLNFYYKDKKRRLKNQRRAA
jgi:hypothetical protein